MALRFEKGKLRPQPPRIKDVPHRKRTRERDRNQDAKGHFTAGNDAARGKRLKAIIKRQLGRDATGQVVERVYAETVDVYRACCRALPGGADVAQVQDTLARRARWSVLSAHYALLATELGLGTEAGDRALEMALKLDARAERLDVTALDLAERLGSDPERPVSLIQFIERAAAQRAPLAPPTPPTEADNAAGDLPRTDTEPT